MALDDGVGSSAGHRSVGARLAAALSSPRLAIGLLIAVLAACVVGATILRGDRSWAWIFSSLWFNGLLVLLAVSSAATFFSRIWRRKPTLLSAGMILFHLSFVSLLGAVVYNNLFHFRGVLRLTEGETLPNGDPGSYDVVERGRFFRFERLRGRTTLLRMHRNFKVDGANKRAAYEIGVGEAGAEETGLIYVTEHFESHGVRYFCSKEGYSVLVVMSDAHGRELYGAHVPLQSLKQPDGRYLYATGSARGPAPLDFPAPPSQAVGALLVTYRPSVVVERQGDVGLRFTRFHPRGADGGEVDGLVPVGGRLEAGDLAFQPREIRYWVGIEVRCDPGQTAILATLCAGLAGIVLTFVGRVRQGAARKRSAQARDLAQVGRGRPRTESP